MKKIFFLCLLLVVTTIRPAKAKDLIPCPYWPKRVATEVLLNAGKIMLPDDMGVPQATYELLAFEKIGPNLAREVYLLTFKDPKRNTTIKVITQSKVTSEECSGGSDVKVFVIKPSRLPEYTDTDEKKAAEVSEKERLEWRK